MNTARTQFDEEISLKFSLWLKDFSRYARFTFGHTITDELVMDIYCEAIAQVCERLSKQSECKEVLTYKDYLFITFRNNLYTFYEKRKRLPVEFAGDVTQNDYSKLVYYLDEEDIYQTHAEIDTQLENRLNEVSEVLSKYGGERHAEQFAEVVENLYSFEELTSAKRQDLYNFLRELDKNIAVANYTKEHGRKPGNRNPIFVTFKEKRQQEIEHGKARKEQKMIENRARKEKALKRKQTLEQNKQKHIEARLIRQQEQAEKTSELKRKKQEQAEKTNEIKRKKQAEAEKAKLERENRKKRVRTPAATIKENASRETVAVAKIDLKTGDVIAFYATKKQAEVENNCNVSHHLLGKCTGIRTGYSFRYATVEEVERYKLRQTDGKKVEKYNAETSEILAVYGSLNKAAIENKLCLQTLHYRVKKGLLLQGIGFRYANEEINKVVVLAHADTIPAE